MISKTLFSSLLDAIPKGRYLYLVLWIIWFLCLWYLSSGTLPKMPDSGIQISDKVLHWGYFGIGGALMTFFALSLSNLRKLNPSVFIGLLLLGMAVGAIDEVHQCWNLNRSGKDFGDFLADTIGTLSGIVVAQKVWLLLSQTFYCKA